MSTTFPQRLLLVCYGNLCRSPMAEGLMRARLDSEGWRVESAGTHALRGSPPSPLAVEVVAEDAGIDIGGCRSTRLSAEGIRRADHVMTMSRAQAERVVEIVPGAADRTRLFGAFAPPDEVPPTADFGSTADPGGPSSAPDEVPDPMGGSVEEYRACYVRLRATADACAAWLRDGANPADAPPSLAASGRRGPG